MSYMDDREKAKKQKKSRVVYNSAYMLVKVFRYAPDVVIFSGLYAVARGMLNSVSLLLTVNLLNALDEGKPFSVMAGMIGTAALAFLVLRGFDRIYYLYLSPRISQRLHYAMHKELLLKAWKADLACYDDPEYYNDFVWAMNNADGRAIDIVNDFRALISTFVYSGSVFGVIFTVSPVVTVVLMTASVLQLLIDRKANKLYHEESEKGNVLSRKVSYLNRVFYLSDYAKELRTSRVGELFKEQYAQTVKEQIALKKEYSKKYFLLETVCGNLLVGNCATFGTMIFLFILLVQGKVEIGGFAASVTSCWALLWLLTDLAYTLMRFPLHALYTQRYIEFMQREPKVVSGGLPAKCLETLTLENVRFAYKEGGEEILKGVSMEIHQGEKVAFVGYNGAGKTTLIKLLLRLYDPTGGRILYNGEDLKNYDTESPRARMGAVFQDFKLFAATIGENVMGSTYGEEDKEAILQALKAVSFTEKLATLEKGIETPLTREFDDGGVNLSGGESQKIAIARVFARPYDLIVLDEPSSALDPVAEYELNRSILEHCTGKTVVFISHRLSTTRMADRIYMFDGGKIIESGSHEELLQQNGKYAEMFRMQSENYKKGA